MSNNNILVIGIAGGTGSGKSTLTKQLVNHFGDQITVLKSMMIIIRRTMK